MGEAYARTETFTYDALDRLRSAVTQLAGSTTAARTLSLTYDRLGNLKSKGSSVTGDTGASAYTYGNGMSGQPALTELASVSIGGVSHALTHDAWGRVKRYDRSGTATEDRYIGWNARHLPTTVTVGDSLTDTTPKAKDEFLYGPDGQRYYKKSTWEVPGDDPMTPPTYSMEHTYYAGTHREVVRVGDTTNLSVATSTVSAAVLHVKTTPITGTATTALEYLHRDHLGSVESVTGATGTELKVQAYDPFGSRRGSDWTRALTETERTALAAEAPQRTARGYTGHEHLERTGLIHMNGRVYDPAIGRFLSPDPVVADASFSQSWNAYSYALNSPLSYSDPSGLTLVAGCPPSVCGGGGRGGFAPGSVLASSSHLVRTVQYTLSVSFGGWMNFGFPTVDTGNPLILNIRNARGARRASSLESGRHRSPARYGPRVRFTVQGTVQTHNVGVTAPVDIGGGEQGEVDEPMGLARDRVLLAQATETPQAELIDELIEAAINGVGMISLKDFVGRLSEFSQDELDAMQERGDVIFLNVQVSVDSMTATGVFENTGVAETVIRVKSDRLKLDTTIRGTFRVTPNELSLENLEGMWGRRVITPYFALESIRIDREGNFEVSTR